MDVKKKIVDDVANIIEKYLSELKLPEAPRKGGTLGFYFELTGSLHDKIDEYVSSMVRKYSSGVQVSVSLCLELHEMATNALNKWIEEKIPEK